VCQIFSSSDLPDVHGFRGGRFGLDAEQAREVFPEDQIQLIRIEARVFDDLADLETERQCQVRSQEKGLRPLSHPIADAVRQSQSLRVQRFDQKFGQLRNSVPREAPGAS
jgi:hypothetical protein